MKIKETVLKKKMITKKKDIKSLRERINEIKGMKIKV